MKKTQTRRERSRRPSPPPTALSLKSAKAKMDRAKAFAEAYGTPAVTHATNDENDPECVSDPDEPEEDTDRAAVGAGGRRAHGSGKVGSPRTETRAGARCDERRERRTTRRIGSIRVHAHERKRRRRFWDERRRSARGASPLTSSARGGGGFVGAKRKSGKSGNARITPAPSARDSPPRASRRRKSKRWTRWINPERKRFILIRPYNVRHASLTVSFCSKSERAFTIVVHPPAFGSLSSLVIRREIDPSPTRRAKPRLLPELDQPPNDLAPRRVVHGHDTRTLRRRRLGVARQKLLFSLFSLS